MAGADGSRRRSCHLVAPRVSGEGTVSCCGGLVQVSRPTLAPGEENALLADAERTKQREKRFGGLRANFTEFMSLFSFHSCETF